MKRPKPKAYEDWDDPSTIIGTGQLSTHWRTRQDKDRTDRICAAEGKGKTKDQEQNMTIGLIICLIGLFGYLACNRVGAADVAALAKDMFWVGLLAFLFGK